VYDSWVFDAMIQKLKKGHCRKHKILRPDIMETGSGTSYFDAVSNER
jgi:hypothetical protein